MTEHPRAKAFEREQARVLCEKNGHLRPTIAWYSSNRGKLPCRRGCGESVDPALDFEGHP